MRKWRTIFGVYFADAAAYRAQAAIWMLTDAVPAALIPLLWLASYQGRGTIGGYTPSQMVGYYLAGLAMMSFTISHAMWDVGREIREGIFSIHLTRPVSYMAYTYAGNLCWRLVRLILFFPIAGLIYWMYSQYLHAGLFSLTAPFWAAVAGAHLLSFVISYGLGLLALFFTETRSIYMFYYIPLSLLNGEMVPLSTLPHWAQHLSRWFPFRYTVSFPLEILQNRLSGAEILFGFGMMAAWLVVAWLATRVLWTQGLRRYTGVGL